MRTALDTNILSPVLSGAPEATMIIAELLRVRAEGALVISGPVFVELSAIPGLNFERTEKALKESSIAVDFDLGEDVWRLAASSFSAYATRRRRSGAVGPLELGQRQPLTARDLSMSHSQLSR